MPGLIGRISTLIKAKISKLVDRAENPAETLDYAYERQLEDLQNVKKGIADVVTAKKRLQIQESQLNQQTEKLDGQAREAMSAGREDLARAALERKQLIICEIGSLDQQVTELESEQEKLTAAEQQLRTKIEAFRSKKEVIKAQYSAAEAQVRISEAATGVGDEMADVGLAMQRALDKTENMKARASAVQELQAAGTFEDLTALARRRTISTGSSSNSARRAPSTTSSPSSRQSSGLGSRHARSNRARSRRQRGRDRAAQRYCARPRKKNGFRAISVVGWPRVEMQHSRLHSSRSSNTARSRSSGAHTDSGGARSSASATPRPNITSPSNPTAIEDLAEDEAIESSSTWQAGGTKRVRTASSRRVQPYKRAWRFDAGRGVGLVLRERLVLQ